MAAPALAGAPKSGGALRWRADFPALAQDMNARPLVYLDSAASAQKPRAVLERIQEAYGRDYANIHRGVYELSQRATALHDEARRKVQRFVGARDWREVIFTRNATEAINLAAFSFVEPMLEPGDEILITEMEHHANIVPWQLAAERTGAKLVAAPITEKGALDLDGFAERLNPRTKFASVVWISNALGTINPVDDLIALCRAKNVPILIDGSQAAPHQRIDVQDLDADFLAFTGHKLYGPTGVGVLWGKASRLEAMRPYQGGGDMIDVVTIEKTTYADIPFRFEAGTPDIVGAQALGAAIDYVEAIGFDAIEAHEKALYAYADRALRQVPGLRMVGDAPERAAALSFVLASAHAQDVGALLDLDGIAIRTGHHCAMPVLKRLGVGATARASIGLYNTEDDVDALVASLRDVERRFA